MINIFNEGNNSETIAAENLKNLFLEEWPEFGAENVNNWINIYVEPFLREGSVKTADLVVLGAFEKPVKICVYDEKNLFLKNFFFNIEVKRHDSKQIKFEGGHVKVFYTSTNNWKDASDQAHKQYWAIQNHIRYNYKDPWLSGSSFIKLENISEDHEQVPKDKNGNRAIEKLILNSDNIKNILKDLTKELYRTKTSAEKKETQEGKIISSFFDKDEAYFRKGDFFPTMIPSFLDEKRMREISQGSYRQQWLEQVGKKLLIFQGHGGTGKTVRLLQTAQKLIISQGASCLFLTFNIPLRSTLLRLARLMNIHIRQEKNSGGIAFEGVMKFCSTIIQHANHKLDLNIDLGKDFTSNLMKTNRETGKTNYLTALEEIGEYIETEAISAEELSDLAKEAYRNIYGDDFDYEYVFIDECQDWNSIERDLVIAYFSPKKTICAHGYAQETRGKTLFWTKALDKESYYDAQLSKAVRMKQNLSRFIKDFSKEAFKEDSYSEMQIHEEGAGGEIHVIEGDLEKYFLFKEDGGFLEEGYLNKSILRDGTMPIDYLYCVPDNMKKEIVGVKPLANEYCEIGALLKRNKVEVWDATTDYKNNLPKEDQLRIVNYSTCRGLEGWIVFNFYFDEAYNYNVEKFKKDKKEEAEILAKSKLQIELFDIDENFNDLDEEAENHAAKMSLIALTRGVSEIVIHISTVDSKIGRILKKMSEQNIYKDIIQWRKL